MRGIRCILVAGLLLAFAYGQTVRAQHSNHQDVKYWIFLTDKRDAAGKTTPVDADYLTTRARARRVQRGTTPSSTLDAPLSPVYLDELRRQGITPLVQSRWLNAVSAGLDARQYDAVRELPFVRDLRPVARTPALATYQEEDATPAPLLPLARRLTRLDYGGSETQLDLINAIPALERGINGTGVRLGILDTEFGGFEHPAFTHLVSEGRLLADSNFVGQSQGDRHGLRVASIAVGFDEGELIGPAYGAKVMAATTEFASGPDSRQEEDNFVAALEWMEREGVDVVNASLTYNFPFEGGNNYTPDQMDGDTGVTTVAADRAAMLGVVVVAAAGNEGGSSWNIIGTPADGDSVIAVGAVTSGGVKAGFSSFGPTADGRIKPDVAAMGTGMYLASSSGSYSSGGQGTSFSAPLVAAVACQILQANPDLNPMEVRDLLRETASQAANPDNALGWGIIDADAAITRAEELVGTGTEDEAPVPDAFEVRPPYPNPFSDQTVFEVHAPAQAGFARMSVYNLIGQRIGVPFEGRLNPGVNRIVFRTETLPPGLYLYTLEGDRVSLSGKMVLIR